MQAAATHRLHWSPVEPSWLVSAALVLLAVLPHQLPSYIRGFLTSAGGVLLYIAATAWVFTTKPVLAIAMALLFIGVWTYRTNKIQELFTAPVNLVKDRVEDQERRRRWFQEEILSEDPHGIQERTENPDLLHDVVSDHERNPWLSEDMLNEHPLAIQERPISSVSDYDNSGH
jgi:hypothetical protein